MRRHQTANTYRLSLAALLGYLWLPPTLADTPPERGATLAADLAGPAIDWNARVIDILRDGDDSCFLLARLDVWSGAGQRFLACHPGMFGADFAPGRVVRARGNLGEARPRRIAGRTFTEPLLVAPFLEPGHEPLPAGYPPPYYSPYYPPHPWPWHDPRYRPWPPYNPW